MGLNASSHEWCSRSDVVIEGLPWTRKIVDDILIWAESEEELMERMRVILNRCKEHNITISRKKLELGTDLRSFLGLANQLAAFVPDPVHISAGLRPLLKKGNVWVWEKEHEEEFNKIKNLLTSPTIA